VLSHCYFANGRDAKYCDQHVCLSICLSVRLHVSKPSVKISEDFPYMLFVLGVRLSSDGNVTVLANLWNNGLGPGIPWGNVKFSNETSWNSIGYMTGTSILQDRHNIMTLCTSGLWMTFSHNGANGPESKATRVLSMWRHRGKVCRLQLQLV